MVVTMLILALVSAALAVQGWLLLGLRAQTRRVGVRLDALAEWAAGVPGVTASEGATAAEPVRPAPAFALPSLAGVPTSLAALLAGGRPVVLTFTDPRCGPCYELLPDIGGWQRVYGDRLTFALVSGGTPEQNRAMTAEYGIDPRTVLIQAEREVANALGAAMAPAAILIRPDGRAGAGPVYGVAAVRTLVAGALGLAVPPAPDPAHEPVVAVRRGHPVPALRRPDLDGRAIDVAALRGQVTVLLFWSPGCGHCQALLPAMRAWEDGPDGPRLLVVTDGPVGLNRDAALRSPMVADDDRSVRRAFGVRATPSAVLIDARGLVASDVARGAAGVRALVAAHSAPQPVAVRG